MEGFDEFRKAYCDRTVLDGVGERTVFALGVFQSCPLRFGIWVIPNQPKRYAVQYNFEVLFSFIIELEFVEVPYVRRFFFQ